MPQFYENGVGVQHPLEQLFNASGWDILSAVERGFRAQVDVKGKLAELFLYRHLQGLAEGGLIAELSWRDKDGIPDFGLEYKGRKLQMECKNVRSGDAVFKDGFKVEIQKTRSQIGGVPSRGYHVGAFDVLAVCLFNQTGEWKYLFSATAKLSRRPDPHGDYPVIMQKVPYSTQDHWHASVSEALTDAIGS